MKANPCLRNVPALPILLAVAALGASLLGACSQPQVVPPPRPTPLPAAKPAPLPRSTVDWRQAPLTPGDWTWAMEGGQSVARFAGGQLVLRCDPSARTVTMLRPGRADGPVPMSISTSAMTRPLMGTAQAVPQPAIALTFPARDPLLDAMAFSRGRFAVETAGLATLYVPSWTEVSRVIEDCR